jgi:hypothetical protein
MRSIRSYGGCFDSTAFLQSARIGFPFFTNKAFVYLDKNRHEPVHIRTCVRTLLASGIWHEVVNEEVGSGVIGLAFHSRIVCHLSVAR